MKISEKTYDYLAGKNFSNGYSIKTSESEKSIPSRIETLLEICKGKRVVHLGCADHLEIIDLKIANNTWLHQLLSAVTVKCIGIDNNEEAMTHLRNKGIPDLITADITRDAAIPAITESHWDFMVLGEIIEHIGNPVNFLEELRKRYAGCVERIVLTTPNAFRYKNFTRAALRHQELVNSDHRFWFTPYTLARVAMDAGLLPEEFYLVENLPTRRSAFLKKIMLKRYPTFRDTIVMVCNLNR
jgi:2-polyprenyl-3-methyl-5-hydroxy-6-metoxy-1,4-benzoquinol methylase